MRAMPHQITCKELTTEAPGGHSRWPPGRSMRNGRGRAYRWTQAAQMPSGQLVALEPAAQVAAAAPGPRRRLDWGLILPPAVTMIVMLWGISAPSYWRDESATLSATERSYPQMLAMLCHIDAVHGLYYLLLWPVAHLAGAGELETRLRSAMAMAAAALGVAMIGRRARSRRAGMYAGLLFACLPMVSV